MATDRPHSFRVADDLWNQARAAATRRDTNVTRVLTKALTELVEVDRAERAFTEGLASDRAAS